MNAKYVFNVHDEAWAGTLFKMADLAVGAGYELFIFNDRIYYVAPRIDIYQTKLTRRDIFVI